MPLYEFECEACGARFEELVAAGVKPTCPSCEAKEVRRRWSPVAAAGPAVALTGRAAAESNARRSEREAKRKERFAEDRKRRRSS
jgi:putative FmdB family regulatory protein